MQRKQLRLSSRNYSDSGKYLVTICCKNKVSNKYSHHEFSKIVDGKVLLSDLGDIVKECWVKIPDHFKNIELGKFVIMPDHLHGILEIKESGSVFSNNRSKMFLPKVVQNFKAAVSRESKSYKVYFGGWLRSFHDRVIRSGGLDLVEKYILENPKKWKYG